MTRRALVILTFALAAGLGTSSVFSQTPPNTTQLQPAPDIPSVIKGGTMPEATAPPADPLAQGLSPRRWAY
jgi:hypothetical protein